MYDNAASNCWYLDQRSLVGWYEGG